MRISPLGSTRIAATLMSFDGPINQHPLVSEVIDNSGSIMHKPQEPGQGYRAPKAHAWSYCTTPGEGFFVR